MLATEPTLFAISVTLHPAPRLPTRYQTAGSYTSSSQTMNYKRSHTSSSGRLYFQIMQDILLLLVNTIFLHFCCLKMNETHTLHLHLSLLRKSTTLKINLYYNHSITLHFTALICVVITSIWLTSPLYMSLCPRTLLSVALI